MKFLDGILSIKKNGQTMCKNNEYCIPNKVKTSSKKNIVNGIDYTQKTTVGGKNNERKY